MNADIQTSTRSDYERRPRKSKSPAAVFLAVWILLVTTGVLGTIWYTEQMKQRLADQVTRQTAQQITAMRADYESQIKKLEKDLSGDIAKLHSKVDALNQLLEFSKDNANNKTDNSNKLYSQMNDVMKKLNELKKNMDVLK